MPNSKNNQQSKSKKKDDLPYGFKAKAERISAEYRGLLNLKPHDPCPSNLLTDFLKVHVKELDLVDDITPDIIADLLDEFESAFSAVTLYCPDNNRNMIVHNHKHASARKESNIMHECAHLILKHPMEEFDDSNGFILRNYNDVHEAEAKYLGHCLQLPKVALTKYFVYGGKSKEDIAAQFNASMQVVDYRILICSMNKFKNFVQSKSK